MLRKLNYLKNTVEFINSVKITTKSLSFVIKNYYTPLASSH